MDFLNNDPETRPKWEQWHSLQKAKLWRLLALSLDIHPVIEAARKYQEIGPDYKNEYVRRNTQARNSLSELRREGEILWYPSDPNNGTHAGSKMVDIHSFVAWASRMKWPMPPEMSKFGAAPLVTFIPEMGDSASKVPKNVSAAANTRKGRTEQKLLLAALYIAIGYKGPEQDAEAVATILEGLARLGLSVSESTVSDRLKEAVQQCL
ncbi:MAG: hypothetical protein JWQ21_820 [Herminiimonas sp.]|nr:hypothetical protein [Herminiimonas sp.]